MESQIKKPPEVATGQVWQTPGYKNLKTGEVLQEQFAVVAVVAVKTDTDCRQIAIVRRLSDNVLERVHLDRNNIFTECQLIVVPQTKPATPKEKLMLLRACVGILADKAIQDYSATKQDQPPEA